MPDQNGKPAWKRYVPRIFRKDLARKLIALFLASVIYIAVMDRLSSTREINGIHVPVNPPAGFVLMENGSPTVRLTVAANQSRLKTLKPEDFSIIDLELKPEYYQEGKPYILQLTPSNFQTPLGVSVVSVAPASLSVDIDKLETKELEVKVEPDSKLPPPSGYKVKKFIVSPAKVRVTAPSSILKTLNDVKTSPIDLSMMTQDFDINKDVVFPRQDIKISPQEVMVRIMMERSFEEKTFKNLKIHIMQDSDKKIEIYSERFADVTVLASSEVLEKLSRNDIKVYALASNISDRDTHTLKLEAAVSGRGIAVRKIVPETVKVIVK